jgi:hypothetical protein
MPYRVTHHKDKEIVEAIFQPPVEPEEYFEFRDKVVLDFAKQGITRFFVDVSEMVFEDFSHNDMIVDFAESWDTDAGKAINIVMVLPNDLKSQDSVYMMSQLSRMKGINIRTCFASERESVEF